METKETIKSRIAQNERQIQKTKEDIIANIMSNNFVKASQGIAYLRNRVHGNESLKWVLNESS